MTRCPTGRHAGNSHQPSPTRRDTLSSPPSVTPWAQLVATQLPHRSRSQAPVLAWWSLGLVRDSIPVPPERRVLDTVLAWHNGLPVLPRLAALVLAFDLIWLLAALKLFKLVRSSLRLPVAMLAVVAALCFGSVIVDEVGSRRANEGVIVAEQVVGRKGPDPVGYAPSFRAPLHAGVEFAIVEERPGWYLVRLRDDRETWLPVSAVERV